MCLVLLFFVVLLVVLVLLCFFGSFGCVEFACFFRGLNYRKSPRFQLTGSRKIAGVHLLDA